MPFTTTPENVAVDAIKAAASWISLHTGDPGSNGAAEVTGGAYARKQTNWGVTSNSQSTGSAAVIDVPAGTTVTHWGLWTAANGGTFYYGGTLPAQESFGAAGTYSLTPTLQASD